MAVVAPLAATRIVVGSLRVHTTIRGGEPVGQWTLVRPEPGVRIAATLAFSTASSLAQPDLIADLHVDYDVPPVDPVAGIVSLPPAEPIVAADAIPLPPINPLLPEPKSAVARSSPRDSGMRLAATSSSVVLPARDERDPGRDMLAALTKRVQPALPDARRNDIVGSVSAYNNPDLPPARGSDRRTAVYDIAAHTVYLPNGERLEAHSGLGGNFDNPRSVHMKNRGATPPNVYELTLRERPFHGVAALRMNPVGTDSMFGRDGILAHSYLLGPRGESNGCVSFKDYARFLQAFRRGEVSRLLVVTRLNGSPASAVARLRASDIRYAADGKNTQR